MASYRDAIAWIAANDDTEWLHDERPVLSVTGALVADLFRKSDEAVAADIRKAVEKRRRDA